MDLSSKDSLGCEQNLGTRKRLNHLSWALHDDLITATLFISWTPKTSGRSTAQRPTDNYPESRVFPPMSSTLAWRRQRQVRQAPSPKPGRHQTATWHDFPSTVWARNSKREDVPLNPPIYHYFPTLQHNCFNSREGRKGRSQTQPCGTGLFCIVSL